MSLRTRALILLNVGSCARPQVINDLKRYVSGTCSGTFQKFPALNRLKVRGEKMIMRRRRAERKGPSGYWEWLCQDRMTHMKSKISSARELRILSFRTT